MPAVAHRVSGGGRLAHTSPMVTTTLVFLIVLGAGALNLGTVAFDPSVGPEWASTVNTLLLIILAFVAKRNGDKSDRNHEKQEDIAQRIETVASKVDNAAAAAAHAADAAASAAESSETASRIAKDVGADVREKRRLRWYSRG